MDIWGILHPYVSLQYLLKSWRVGRSCMFPSFAALLQKFFLCEEDFQGAEELQVSYSLNEGTSNLLFLNEFVTSKETQVLKLSFNRCTSGLMG